MPPVIVDSTQCHLWTDALHLRELARQTSNQWDRGTYVRMSVLLAWTALELACQDALENPGIGYSFVNDIDRALKAKTLIPINWGHGIWQKARALQELRKTYVHRFATLNELFADTSVAEDAIDTVRSACTDIYNRAQQNRPPLG